MITKGIDVKSTEQKLAANNTPYLEVKAEIDGVSKTYAVFDQALWNIFAPNTFVQITLEKQGNFWNITKAQQVAKPPEAKQATEKPKTTSDPEQGMWWKEVGEWLRSGRLDTTEGKTGALMKRVYFAKMFEVLGIEIESKETLTKE